MLGATRSRNLPWSDEDVQRIRDIGWRSATSVGGAVPAHPGRRPGRPRSRSTGRPASDEPRRPAAGPRPAPSSSSPVPNETLYIRTPDGLADPTGAEGGTVPLPPGVTSIALRRLSVRPQARPEPVERRARHLLRSTGAPSTCSTALRTPPSTCCSARAASAATGPAGCSARLARRPSSEPARPAWPSPRPGRTGRSVDGRRLRRRGPRPGARPQGARHARAARAACPTCWPDAVARGRRRRRRRRACRSC